MRTATQLTTWHGPQARQPAWYLGPHHSLRTQAVRPGRETVAPGWVDGAPEEARASASTFFFASRGTSTLCSVIASRLKLTTRLTSSGRSTRACGPRRGRP